MGLSAIQAAREYVEDAISRQVHAISPRTLSDRLGSTEEEAVAILKTLRDEGYGGFRGYVKCPWCGEGAALKSTTLIDLHREAGDLVGAMCRYCGKVIAENRDDIEVQLSFFLKAVVQQVATAPSVPAPNNPASTALSLQRLQAADRL